MQNEISGKSKRFGQFFISISDEKPFTFIGFFPYVERNKYNIPVPPRNSFGLRLRFFSISFRSSRIVFFNTNPVLKNCPRTPAGVFCFNFPCFVKHLRFAPSFCLLFFRSFPTDALPLQRPLLNVIRAVLYFRPFIFHFFLSPINTRQTEFLHMISVSVACLFNQPKAPLPEVCRYVSSICRTHKTTYQQCF